MIYIYILLFNAFELIFFSRTSTGFLMKYEKCIMKDGQKKFNVLPGLGWDNLENTEKGRILDLSFSLCNFSDDNKYLLPNHIFLIPKKSSKVELFAENFDHYFNYTSILSKSMKTEASGIFYSLDLSGKFSEENSLVKTYQLESKSKITRVQLRYNIYKSQFDPDSPLSQSFKDRIINFARWIKIYNDTLYTSYLADMIIRDFGTHVIRSVDAGAVLSKTDIMNQNYIRQYYTDSNIISASSSASFFNFLKLNYGHQTSATYDDVSMYNKNTVRTIIKAHGGTMFGPEMELNRWIHTVNENLVAIDKTGDPIYHVLNRKVLPMLSSNTIHRIANLLQDSVNRYYSANARKGCVDFLSPNFNSDANLDDGQCISPIVKFNFGGVYETCDGPDNQCGWIRKKNYLTGWYSCPNGFSSVMLHRGLNECRQICESWMFFWSTCDTQCSYFKIFWCRPLIFGSNHNGYRFGGFISVQMPVCPVGYFAIYLGITTKLCVSTTTSPKDQHAIGFGGLFSCSVGNPLAQSFFKDTESRLHSSFLDSPDRWIKGCAEGYVAHIAVIDRNCKISFCTETNKFSLGPKPNLKRLPFFQVSININESSPKHLYSAKGELFIENFCPNGIYNHVIVTGNYVLSGIIIAIFLSLLIFGIVIVIRKRIKNRKQALSAKSTSSENAGTCCTTIQ